MKKVNFLKVKTQSMLFLVSFLFAKICLWVIFFGIVGFNSGMNLFGSITFIIPYVVVNIIGTSAVYLVALRKGFYEKLYHYFDRKLNEKMKRHQQKILKLKQELEIHKSDLRRSYLIIAISSTSKPFTFLCTLSDPIYKDIVPIVTVNRKLVPVEMFTETQIYCHIESVISSQSEWLIFSTGKNSEIKIANPYFINTSIPVVVLWQCEGYAHERCIFISKSYFPYVNEQVPYPFALYVHGKKITDLRGGYNGKHIVIPLEKTIHKSDCVGKEVVLSITCGSRSKIVLPPPTLIFKEGKCVLS